MKELAKRIHQNAKNKGFWTDSISPAVRLMLIVGEVGEALEAHRNGRKADMEKYNWVTQDEDFNPEAFRNTVKDSFEDELADVVIRILDVAEGDNVNIYRETVLREFYDFEQTEKHVGERLFCITQDIGLALRPDGNYDAYSLASALRKVIQLAADMDINIWEHVQLKAEYNTTRQLRHGKTY